MLTSDALDDFLVLIALVSGIFFDFRVVDTTFFEGDFFNLLSANDLCAFVDSAVLAGWKICSESSGNFSVAIVLICLIAVLALDVSFSVSCNDFSGLSEGL